VDAQTDFVKSTIGSFYAGFFRWVNLLAMFLQLFVVGRLVKMFGVRAGLLWLPIIALGSYALVMFLPLLKFVRIGKTVENASDYSINNTTRHMLFLPTSRDIKYKAKQVIDSFFHRVGDVGSALVVFVGTMVLHLDVRGFAFINILFIVCWFFIVRAVMAEHREIEAGNRPELTGEIKGHQAA
jgi:AAA family ATP:ADP antiporter